MFRISPNKKFEENTIPIVKRIHPGIKFLGFIFIVVFTFLANSFFAQMIFLCLLFFFWFIARVQKKVLIVIIKSFVIMFLLFLVINWIFYKNPIAFDINGFSLIGPKSYLENLNWNIHSNISDGIFVSEIWGGNIIGNITSEMVNHFTGSSVVNQWFKNNDADINNLINIPSFVDTAEKKQAFLYLMNNKFTFEGVKYNVCIVDSLASNAIVYDPKYSILYETHWYTISPTAFIRAAYISIKILCILIASSILTETTTSVELSTGLETMLSPFKIIKIPVNEIAMIIAITIRFIPSLLSESKRILNAQAARGVDFHNGNIFVKMKSLVSLVVPLFSIAFKNSEELSNAMEARSYNPRAYRTRYRIYHYSWYDSIFLFLIIFFGTLVTCIKFMNIFCVFFGMAEGDLSF